MSNVAQGPGWWMASDGRWYPPESHPSARPSAAPPGSAFRGGSYGALPAGARLSPSGSWARTPTAARPTRDSHATTGWYAFVVLVASGVVVGMSFLSWYSVGISDNMGFQLPTSLKPTFSLVDQLYGGFRIAVPAVAGVTAVFALVGIALWWQRTWPTGYGWYLRFGALATLVLVIVSMVLRQPALGPYGAVMGALGQRLGAYIHWDLGWAAWAGAVCALVATIASFKTHAGVR